MNKFGRFLVSFIVGMLLGFGAIKTDEYFNSRKQIESLRLIIPIKELVINNNKVDTIYIYKQPQKWQTTN